MQVFYLVLLYVGYTAARGSGPYLPSGWKPAGPAFYLPSEIQKPADNPLKEVILETEPAGSDSLREYGPPKVQEVSQDISNQGLPDTATDQSFVVVENGIETAAVLLEGSVDEKQKEKTESRQEVSTVVEVQKVEEKLENVPVVEDKPEAKVEPLANQPLQDSILESTERSLDATIAVEAVVAEVEGAVTESDVKVQEVNAISEVVKTQVEQELEVSEKEVKINKEIETAAQVLEKVQPILEEVKNEEINTIEEVKSVVSEEIKAVEEVKEPVIEVVKSIEEVKESVAEEVKVIEQVKEAVAEEVKAVEEVKEVVANEVKAVEDVKEAVSEEVKAVEEVKEAVAEEIKAVEEVKAIVVEEVKTAEDIKEEVAEVVKQAEKVSEEVKSEVLEEVKSVGFGISNIAQALANVENEIKAEEAEKTINLELSGSLADAPEGFLEYGPPGFREYGPPKGDDLLRSNALEQESNEYNEARRRRFSPKFRPPVRPQPRKQH